MRESAPRLTLVLRPIGPHRDPDLRDRWGAPPVVHRRRERVRRWLRGRAIAGSRCLHDEYVFVTINDLLSMRGELTTIFNYEKLHIIFNSSRPAATPHA